MWMIAKINNNKFNGQELQDELGLNVTAMDWRQYDMAVGRFVCVDPVTHHSQSPYNAFDGNPVICSDPSGADSIVYGMSGQSVNSNFHNRGNDSFGNASYNNNYIDPLRRGSGSGWGDGGLLPWGQTFYGAQAVDILKGFSSTFVKGPPGTVDSKGNVVVYSGHWVQNSSSGFDIANGIAGNFLAALDSRATANAGLEFKYGTRTVSAAALTETNAVRMLNLSKFASGVGSVLAIGTGAYGLNKEYENYRNTGSYNGQAVFDNIFSLAGGIAGGLLLAAEISTAIAFAPAVGLVLTTVAIGATAYGVITLGRDLINYNH